MKILGLLKRQDTYQPHFNGTFRSSRPEADECNVIKRETLAQVFSCEFYEVFKKTFFCTIPLVVASVRCFFIRPKFRLKNQVTTFYRLQCKANFFFCLCFWGKNIQQIKEHLSRLGTISIQKKYFWLGYARLHSPTLIYIRL